MFCRLHFFLFVAFCSLPMIATSQISKTTQIIMGGSGTDHSLKILPTEDDGILTIGFTTSFGNGGNDILLVKMDSTNQVQWSKAFGGSSSEVSSTIFGGTVNILDFIEVENSNYLICTQTSSYGSGLEDVYLIKIDQNGKKIWGKTIGGLKSDAGYSVKVIPDGGYAIAGYTESIGSGSKDAVLIKTDTSGSVLWTRSFGGTGEDAAISMCISSIDSSFILAGHTNQGSGIYDVLVLKVKKDGTLDWSKVLGGSRLDMGFGVVEDEDGNIYVSGQSESYVTGTVGSDLDCFLIKLTNSGKLIWSRNYGGSSREGGRNIDYHNGFLYFGGWGFSYGASGSSYFGVYHMKIDTAGDVKKTWTYGTSGIQSISINNTIGVFNDKVYFALGTNATSGSGYDFYLINTDINGTSGDCGVGSHSINTKKPTVNSSTHTINTSNSTLGSSSGYASTTVTSIATRILCKPFIAKFGWQKNNCSGNSVQFYDSTTTTATSWNWDFGDKASGSNNTSSSQNPTHTFTGEGKYKIRLIASKSGGVIDSITKEITILPKPSPDFSFSNVCFSDSIFFSNNSTVSSGKLTYLWRFGDGILSSENSPSKKYSSPGNFTVWLIASSESGCKDSISKMVTIFPRANVSFSSNSVCPGNVVSFSNFSSLSSGTMSHEWIFPDGTKSTLTNPSKVFSQSGIYEVKLIVTTNRGCKDSIINTITIQPSPEADFISSDNCVDESIEFINNSTIISGTIASYAWDFGDGSKSSLKAPKHVFTNPGVFDVKLKVTSNAGCIDSVIKKVEVFAKPKALFSFSGNFCAGKELSFTNASTISSGNIVSYEWSFGDGDKSAIQNPVHVYPSGGSYQVKLKISTNNGCIDSVIKTVQINNNPEAAFSHNGVYCANNAINFKNESKINSGSIIKYSWDFNDGNSSTDENPIKAFSQPGAYAVSLKIESATGCRDSITKYVIINSQPDADFTITGQLFQDSNLLFEPVVKDNQIIYAWNFGDGTIDTGLQIVKKYNQSGSFLVRLTAVNQNSCSKNSSKTIVIQKPTSILDSRPKAGYKIYPNPTASVLNVSAQTQFNNTAIRIMGIDGKVYFEGYAKNNLTIYQIDINTLPKGTFWIIISDEKTVTPLSFIKQ